MSESCGVCYEGFKLHNKRCIHDPLCSYLRHHIQYYAPILENYSLMSGENVVVEDFRYRADFDLYLKLAHHGWIMAHQKTLYTNFFWRQNLIFERIPPQIPSIEGLRKHCNN